jgi:hypothetical protein
MDDKTITAISTSLALTQIQVNALLLLFRATDRSLPQGGFSTTDQRRSADGRLGDHAGYQSRIYEGIVQPRPGDNANGQH